MDDLVERLQSFNRSRDPRLVQLKYHMMRSDVFAFYRGTCHLFYQDWPHQTPLNNAPAIWICGDLHWQNLGSYKGDNRLVFFGFNDFDEAVLAPCTWDLARFLVSIHVSATLLKLQAAQVRELCRYFLDIYAKALADGHVYMTEEDTTPGLVHEMLFQTRTRPRKTLLDSRTVQTADGRRLRIDDVHATPASDAEHEAVSKLIELWATSQPNPDFFKVLDVAHRIAGVGSLGVERYVVLAEGKGSPDHNYLLDLKAEVPSSLEPYLIQPQPHWQNQAERAVTIQRLVQGIPPACLAPLPTNSASYVLRELQPAEDKINIAPLGGKTGRVEKLAKVIAKTVAWGQLRSAGHQSAADAYDLMHFAHERQWKKELLKYAQEYTPVVQKDYETFCAAYDHGAFGASVHES